MAGFVIEYINRARYAKRSGLHYQWHYEIKWEGYELDYDKSWEPEIKLLSSGNKAVRKIIEEFWSSIEGGKPKRPKEVTIRAPSHYIQLKQERPTPEVDPSPVDTHSSPPSRRRKRAVSSSPEPEISSKTLPSDVDGSPEKPLSTKRRLTTAVSSDSAAPDPVAGPPVNVARPNSSIIRFDKEGMRIHRKSNNSVDISPLIIGAPRNDTTSRPQRYRVPASSAQLPPRVAPDDSVTAALSRPHLGVNGAPAIGNRTTEVAAPTPPPLEDFIPGDLEDLEDFPEDLGIPETMSPHRSFLGPASLGHSVGDVTQDTWQRALPVVDPDLEYDIQYSTPAGAKIDGALPPRFDLITDFWALPIRLTDIVGSKRGLLAFETTIRTSGYSIRPTQIAIDRLEKPSRSHFTLIARASLEDSTSARDKIAYMQLYQSLERDSKLLRHALLAEPLDSIVLFPSRSPPEVHELLGIPTRLRGLENVLLVYYTDSISSKGEA